MPEILSTLAELGIGLAGFASVVVIFRRRQQGEWEPADAARFRSMLETTLGAAFFGVWPGVASEFGWSINLLWASGSFAIAAFLIVTIGRVVPESLRHLRAGTFKPWASGFIWVGSALIVLLQAANGLGLGFAREPAPYVAGVLWLLVVSGFLFIRLVDTQHHAA